MENCEEPEWTIFSETVKGKGSEHCGVTTGGKSMQKRETWWWNTTVQEAIARKKRMFKNWQQSKEQEDHDAYIEAKREAKRTVAVERARATQELYENLDTRDGENAIYSLAKSRDQATKDNFQGYFVKAPCSRTQKKISVDGLSITVTCSTGQDSILTAETNH